MVIADFDIVGIAIDEAEADTPLLVDCYGVLALPVASESVEPVPGRSLQVVEPSCEIHVLLRTARRATSGGNPRANPFANNSAVRLSAKVLIIAQS